MTGFRRKHKRPEGPGILDLHGYGKYSALQAVHDKLDEATSNALERVSIITGRGLHSPGKKPVIRPAVDAFLDRNCYWRAEDTNPGRFRVLLGAAKES